MLACASACLRACEMGRRGVGWGGEGGAIKTAQPRGRQQVTQVKPPSPGSERYAAGAYIILLLSFMFGVLLRGMCER